MRVNTRGRPRGGTSTWRDRSAVEFTKSGVRDRGCSRSSTGSASTRSSQSSVNDVSGILRFSLPCCILLFF